MKFKLLVILLMMAVFHAFAAVSIINEQQILEEKQTIIMYLSEMKSAFDVVANAGDISKQISSLNQIIALQASIMNLCDRACNLYEIKQMDQYLKQISSEFIDQFKNLATIETNINSLQSVKKYISGISKDSKIIGIALQKAAIEEQQNTNILLVNLEQMLILNHSQEIVEKKIQKHEMEALYSGFTHSGL